jgi:hypothetical protein
MIHDPLTMIHHPCSITHDPSTIHHSLFSIPYSLIFPKLDLLYLVIRSTLVKLSIYIERETLVHEISLGGFDQSIKMKQRHLRGGVVSLLNSISDEMHLVMVFSKAFLPSPNLGP